MEMKKPRSLIAIQVVLYEVLSPLTKGPMKRTRIPWDLLQLLIVIELLCLTAAFLLYLKTRFSLTKADL